MKYSDDIIKRFWSHVDIKNENECWEWKGCKNKKGYGNFNSTLKKTMIVHRFVYIVTYGDFDFSLYVCHKCDNRACCNPKHLFLGTQDDNMKDMVKKNRSSRGEHQFSAQLTEEKVIEIRIRYANGETATSLSEEFHVNNATITEICRGNKWKWADGPITHKGSIHRKISFDLYEEIQNKYKEGIYTMKEIADLYNVGYTTINKIIHWNLKL